VRYRLSLLMFLNYAVQGAFLPVFSVRLQDLGFSPLEIGWICATPALAGLLAPLLAGQLADRCFPAQRCLAFCSLASGVLLWTLSGLVHSANVFLTSLALWAVLGPANTLAAALSFAHLPHPERDFGRIRLWGTIGWVVAGWLVGYLLSQPAWLVDYLPLSLDLDDAFRLAGLLSFAQGAYALTLPHTPPQRRQGAWLAPLAALRLLRNRSFAVYWACSFGLCVTIPFATQVMPLLLEHLGVARQWLAPTMTIGQSSEIVALALLPVLLLRLGTRGTMLLGLAAWALFLSVLTLGDPVELVIASLSLNGLCICCFIVTGQVYVNSRAPADIRASAQALLAWINGLGLFAGHLLAGWVRDQVSQQFAPTFAVAAGLAGLATAAFFVGFQRPEPTAATGSATPGPAVEPLSTEPNLVPTITRR
jgi:MFS family permease